MKHNIEFKRFEPKERIRKLVEELISRLEKHVKDFPEEPVFLRVLIEENAARNLYHVSITLDLPGKTLATKEEKRKANATIRDAFAEIERQIEKYKSTLRGEHLWKRPARREEIRRVLHYVEGQSETEVAKVTGTTEAEVKRYLEYARLPAAKAHRVRIELQRKR